MAVDYQRSVQHLHLAGELVLAGLARGQVDGDVFEWRERDADPVVGEDHPLRARCALLAAEDQPHGPTGTNVDLRRLVAAADANAPQLRAAGATGTACAE